MNHSMTSFSRRTALAALAFSAFAVAACAEDPAPVVAVDETGSVSGILFFDRDNNDVFTPTNGDSIMPGVTVRLLDRGTTSVLGSAVTGTDGRYAINVPVGTHDLDVVRSSAIIANQFIWCGARPSVYANEETFVATPLKFGCVIRINVAKPNALGTTVTIAGVVTAQPGRFRNDNMYIQDQTGGIQVFGVSAALGLIEGDSVEVTGELAAFNDQLQINAPRIAPNVKRGAAIPDPILITTGQAAAATTPLSANIGRLVRVQKVTVGTFASGNAPMDDGSGGTLLRLDSNANTTIGTGRFTAGTCYNITGILGFFRGATQLQPRGPQDVTEVSCS
jgi:DNA/RNA endonuclease YhcR with UshA esterase domain